MQSYRHHQVSWWGLGVVAVVCALIVVATVAAGAGDELSAWFWVVVLAAAAVVMVDASRLTVEVDEHAVHVAFRFGWPRRTIRREEIVAVAPVRVRWYHGWGIRKVRNGWMYNVSGFDAIELSLVDGASFWIGTDDPDGLLAALS
jgi:hypothetical protein